MDKEDTSVCTSDKNVLHLIVVSFDKNTKGLALGRDIMESVVVSVYGDIIAANIVHGRDVEESAGVVSDDLGYC